MYPDIFIAGAPKCGTTTLYDWLAQHPAVFAPDTKEPHHFFNPYGPKMERDRYLALYADARGEEQWMPRVGRFSLKRRYRILLRQYRVQNLLSV